MTVLLLLLAGVMAGVTGPAAAVAAAGCGAGAPAAAVMAVPGFDRGSVDGAPTAAGCG